MKVEYKVVIADAGIASVRSALGLDDAAAEKRDIGFFDTNDLALYARGAILRARRVHGAHDDVTAKVRPVDPAKVDPRFTHLDGFKIEIDRTPTESEAAASLTRDVKGKDIARVFLRERPPRALFTADQEALAASFAVVPWDALSVLGPVDVRVWKRARAPGLPLEATLELWRVPGRDLLELSTRVDEREAPAAALTITAFLAHLGVDAHGVNVSKTKATLDAFARPSATASPATVSPATVSPATVSPATVPPATVPPATVPPATVPPATVPPATVPPATLPPATVPPATVPAATTTRGGAP